jgi:hypothetical protein
MNVNLIINMCVHSITIWVVLFWQSGNGLKTLPLLRCQSNRRCWRGLCFTYRMIISKLHPRIQTCDLKYMSTILELDEPVVSLKFLELHLRNYIKLFWMAHATLGARLPA